MKIQKAFTLVELIVVIVILILAFGMIASSSQVAFVRNDLNSQVGELVSDLRLQQSKATSGESANDFGVRLNSDSYVLFEGASYSESDPNNLSVDFSGSIQIENISLNGGGSDIIFTSPHGRTTQYGSFELVSPQTNGTKTVQINSFGLMEY